MNVEAVLKAADDYNDATFKEPEGTNPKRRRKVINTETEDVENARGGVNIIGDSNNQDSPRIVVLPCTFPTKLEIQNGKIRFTSSGSPFVASMSDPANATAMLVLSIISNFLQTFFPDLVFVVFDVCNTVPHGGHNQADPTNQMWKQFSPHANEFVVKMIAANCRAFFFISPQASRKIGAGNIGTVISTTTLSEKATVTKVAVGLRQGCYFRTVADSYGASSVLRRLAVFEEFIL